MSNFTEPVCIKRNKICDSFCFELFRLPTRGMSEVPWTIASTSSLLDKQL